MISCPDPSKSTPGQIDLLLLALSSLLPSVEVDEFVSRLGKRAVVCVGSRGLVGQEEGIDRDSEDKQVTYFKVSSRSPVMRAV